MYKQLGLGELKPTNITLSLADRSVKIPKGIVEDVLVKVDKFYYLVDFVVLDTKPLANGPNHVPIILGRPFLATANAIINCRNGVMQLTFGNMTLELNIFHLSHKHKSLEGNNEVFSVDHSSGKPNVHVLQEIANQGEAGVMDAVCSLASTQASMDQRLTRVETTLEQCHTMLQQIMSHLGLPHVPDHRDEPTAAATASLDMLATAAVASDPPPPLD